MPSQLLMTQPLTTNKDYGVFPASLPLLKRIKQIDQDTLDIWLNKRHTNISFLKTDKNLRQYQIEGVNKILNRNGVCGVFDQQRLGKTPMVLFSLKIIKPTTTLIVVPKSLLQNWYDECVKWYTDSVVIVKGTNIQRKKIYNKPFKVFITTYQLISHDIHLIPKIDCMIIDEAHRMRNFKGIRSKNSPISVKAIIKKSYEAKYKIAITGTPAPNKPENIYPILHFLYPTIFTSYWYFIDYYFETEEKYISRDQTIQEVAGFKPHKQEELQDFLDYISLQRKRKEYMKWIPKVNKKIINTSLSKEEEKWYNDIVHTYECEELGINCSNSLSQMVALRRITCQSKEKLNWILDYIKDYPDESIIIVSEFTSYLKEIQPKIKNSRIIIGETDSSKRKEIENSFNKGEFTVLLANIDCIKEGMKLEQCATMIVIDPSLTYTDNEQLEDRIIPTTEEIAINKDKQQIIYLIIKDTIDQYIRIQLNNKRTKVEIINNFKKYL